MDIFEVLIMMSKKQAEYVQLATEYDAAITALKSALLLIDEQRNKIFKQAEQIDQYKHMLNMGENNV